MRPASRPWWEGRAARASALAVFVLLLVILLLQALHKANRPHGYDFTSYLLSARALLSGDDPYDLDTPYPYIYPLFLSFILIPLAVVPYGLANVLWFSLNIGALFVSVRILVRLAKEEIGTTWNRHLTVPAVAMFVVLFSPIQNNLLNGQVNLLVLLCTVMFLRCFMRERERGAAIWLAAATAIKLLPALLLVFVLARRRYRLALWTLLFAAVLLALPALCAGDRLLEYYRHYASTFLGDRILGGGSGEHGGTMLETTLRALLPAGGRGRGWIRGASGVLAALGILAADRAWRDAPRSARQVWSFGGYLVGSVLVSPMPQPHHYVFVIPACLLLGMKFFFEPSWAARPARVLAGCFLVLFVGARKVLPAAVTGVVSVALLLILLARAGGSAGGAEPRVGEGSPAE